MAVGAGLLLVVAASAAWQPLCRGGGASAPVLPLRHELRHRMRSVAACAPPPPPPKESAAAAKPWESIAPGTVIDTDGDGIPDALLLDTVGDSKADTSIPIDEALPLQAEVQAALVRPLLEAWSITASITLLLLFAVDPAASSIGQQNALLIERVEDVLSFYFVLEYFARAWAGGLRPRYLLSPLMLVDLLNLVPFLVKATTPYGGVLDALDSPFASLRLLRALRILRLRKFFAPADAQRIVRFVTGDPAAELSEVQRVAARAAFSVVSIVVVSASWEWLVERDVNAKLATYADALYFSITTLTTVGFGDVYPITPSGRFVVALEMIAAVTVIPLELTGLSRVASLEADERAARGEEQPAASAAATAARANSISCDRCGFAAHDADARFCKRCGERINVAPPGVES